MPLQVCCWSQAASLPAQSTHLPTRNYRDSHRRIITRSAAWRNLQSEIRGPVLLRTESDAAGAFRFESVPAGTYVSQRIARVGFPAHMDCCVRMGPRFKRDVCRTQHGASSVFACGSMPR